MTIGYWGLFLASFLSATILPFSSEAILCAMIIGGYNMWLSVIVATMGNWLGSMTTYYLGYIGNWERIEKWLKINPQKTERYIEKVRKYGYWAGILVWLPGIGDVLCVCLGLIRVPPLKTTITIFIGKLARYILLGYMTVVGCHYVF